MVNLNSAGQIWINLHVNADTANYNVNVSKLKQEESVLHVGFY